VWIHFFVTDLKQFDHDMRVTGLICTKISRNVADFCLCLACVQLDHAPRVFSRSHIPELHHNDERLA
jgi:hypothetical protein